MSQPPTDIVRELHGAADRAGLVCTKTGNFRAAMIDAAHLRAAADAIARLTAERDEARREICKRTSTTRWHPQFPLMSEIEYAEARGWDCFKEVKP
jgi:hypothetical protein